MQQRKSIEQDKGIEVKLSLDAVFLPIIAEMEKYNKAFAACKIVSKPKQPADFGISSAIGDGTYDVIKGQVLEQQAKSNAIAPEGLLRYRNCMAFYGAVIAQAHRRLTDMLPGEPVGFEELKDLGKISIEQVLYTGFSGQIKSIYEAIVVDKTPCRFNNALYSFRCGNTLIDLNNQSLIFGNIEWYGGKFGGYTGEYKVSQASKKAKEIIQSQKKAWELAKSGKLATPDRLLAGQ